MSNALEDLLDRVEPDLDTLADRLSDGGLAPDAVRTGLDRSRASITRSMAMFTEDVARAGRQPLASEQRSLERARRLLDRTKTLGDSLAGIEGQIRRAHARVSDPTPTSGMETRSGRPFTLPSLRQYHEAKAGRIGSDPDGGYLVADELGPVADRLRPDAVVLQAGPRLITMASESYRLPKISASATAYAVNEAATITESSPSFAVTQLFAQAYAARALGSVEWFEDAQEDPRRILADDLAKQLALKADHDFLQGDGTSTSPIVGFRNYPGVTKTALGSGDGGTPTLDNLQDAIYRMRANNGRPTAWFMHPRTLNTFRKLKTGLSGDNTYLLRHEPTAEGADAIFGLPVYATSQISIAETLGNSTDCSYVVLADMSQVVVGMRGGVRVLFDEYSYASSRQVQLVMSMRVAFGLINLAGVEVITGVRA